MVKKLLYEAYSARGRKYYTVGYYPDARSNFEAAEIMAWKDNANLLQIFEVQMALALTFGNMHNYSTANAYFEAALKSIDASKRIADKGILDALNSAHKSYINGDTYEAYLTYEKAFADQTIFQKYKQVYLDKGVNLASIASAYNSTIASILAKNDIENTATLGTDGVIQIPTIE